MDVETLNQLLPLVKIVADVGIGVFMAVVVAGGFIWVIRFTIPKITEDHNKLIASLEERHEKERSVDRAAFLEALKIQREHDREVNQRVGEKVEDVCKYQPRGGAGS